MKKFIALSLIVLSYNNGNSQDLSSYQLISHYDLTESTEDGIGNNAELDTINVIHSDQNGIYSNGVYIDGVEPDGSYYAIDSLPFIYSKDFAVQIEFKWGYSAD